MQRISVKARADLAAAAERHEFEFLEGTGIPYWDESAYYRFSARQMRKHIAQLRAL